jgi:hypothetical protein
MSREMLADTTNPDHLSGRTSCKAPDISKARLKSREIS